MNLNNFIWRKTILKVEDICFVDSGGLINPEATEVKIVEGKGT